MDNFENRDEIRFRGMTEKEEYVFGYGFYRDEEKGYIVNREGTFEVLKHTIGQALKVSDNYIYHGDILQLEVYPFSKEDFYYFCSIQTEDIREGCWVFKEGLTGGRSELNFSDITEYDTDGLEVVGNIFKKERPVRKEFDITEEMGVL